MPAFHEFLWGKSTGELNCSCTDVSPRAFMLHREWNERPKTDVPMYQSGSPCSQIHSFYDFLSLSRATVSRDALPTSPQSSTLAAMSVGTSHTRQRTLLITPAVDAQPNSTLSHKMMAFSQRAFQRGVLSSRACPGTGSFVPFTILRAWSTGQPILLNGSRVITKWINQRQAWHESQV